MSDEFNPYHVWLGIPPAEQPADHYRLLGLHRFEDNRDVISHAAEQRIAHLRSMQIGPRSEQTQAILQHLAAARTCLLTPAEKAAYDAQLPPLAPPGPQVGTVSSAAPPPSTARPQQPHPSRGGAWMLWAFIAGMSLILGISLGRALAPRTAAVTDQPAWDRASARPTPGESLSKTPATPVPPPTAEADQRPAPAPAAPPPVSPNSTSAPAAAALTPTEVESPAAVPQQHYAIRLSDPGDAIVLDDTLDLFEKRPSFTIEMWVRFDETNENRSLIGTKSVDFASPGWLLHVPAASGDGQRFITVSGQYRFGTWWPANRSPWRHLALCKDRDISLFVDGALVLLTPEILPFFERRLRAEQDITIGQRDVAAVGHFRGDIRALRISSRVLYEAAETFVPPLILEPHADDLVLLDFSQSGGDTIANRAAAQHHGHLLGGDWIALPEPLPAPGVPLSVKYSGPSPRQEILKFRSPQAEAFVQSFVAQGYRRMDSQSLTVAGAVTHPTVFHAQSLALHGDVQEDIAISAQAATIYGVVEGDLDVTCQSLTIADDAVIRGQLRCSGVQTIWVRGRLEGFLLGSYRSFRF